jgi:hypothetical protein
MCARRQHRDCYVCYVVFMSAQSVQSGGARTIREYIRNRYLEPARRRRESLVTLRAGDIHRELGLRNRVPNVCQVMESRLLEKEAGVKISSKQGPPSGRGTTLTVTYTVDLNYENEDSSKRDPASYADQGTANLQHPGIPLFLGLRGLGAKTFSAEGGGEAFLSKERANFYGPGKKDLK